MQLVFINQPFEGEGRRVGDHLLQLLARNNDFDLFRVAVAWAKTRGITAIFESMQRFRENGGQIEVVVGIDLNGTSVQALRMLRQVAQTVRIFQNANRRLRPTYHPKLYVFSGPALATVILGSSNLTRGGLYVNYEQNARLDFDLANEDDRRVLGNIQAGYQAPANAPNGVVRLLTDELLNQLIQRGLLMDEDVVAPRDRSGDEDSDEIKAAVAPLFGAMDIAAPPPAARRPPAPAPRAPAPAAPAAAAPAAPAPAAPVPIVTNTLVMRPYPARGGTQVQVPQDLASGFFRGIKNVVSQHNGRQHPISPARTKSRSASRSGSVVNTLKLEIPECAPIRVPVIQFEKRNGIVEYRVFDGNNSPQGRKLWQQLQAGLASGASRQTRGNSTIWLES